MSMMTMRLATAMCAVLAAGVQAQPVPEVKLPPSPPGKAAVQVGGTWTKTADGGQRYEGGKWIVVDYSRPLLRGRANIFGAGAEYGAVVSDGSPVWRAGANATTTLTTQVPLVIGGKTIAPGVYNVFVALKAGDWTLVLSNQPRQPKYDPNDKVNLYGSYNYDPTFDVVRVPMGVDSLDQKLEEFTITFLRPSERMLLLTLAWENTVATVPIELAP
jgi:hypothetical protein